MKRTIEIDDTLDERVADVKREVKEAVADFLKDNLVCVDIDNESNISDIINEIADSNTPVYYSEIDNMHYLYGDKLMEAYENAGIYDTLPENWKAVAICIYLENEAREEYQEIIKWFEDRYTSFRDDCNANIKSQEAINEQLRAFIDRELLHDDTQCTAPCGNCEAKKGGVK